MIDTHCHINIEDFNHDVDQVIQHAFSKGVAKLIVIGVDPESNQRAVELADKYEGIYATVGIHPSVADDGVIETLKQYLNHPKVVAIGECGIDLHWRQDNLDQQLKIFDQQIKLSIQYDLPLVIHTRDSFEQAYQAVLPYKGKAKGVFHCFSSDMKDVRKTIDLGFYVGLDGPVTFKNGKDAIVIAKEIPLEWLLVETDSPYLAPTPFRGKRNEPAYLPYIVEGIAKHRNMKIEAVEKQTDLNAIRLFKF